MTSTQSSTGLGPLVIIALLIGVCGFAPHAWEQKASQRPPVTNNSVFLPTSNKVLAEAKPPVRRVRKSKVAQPATPQAVLPPDVVEDMALFEAPRVVAGFSGAVLDKITVEPPDYILSQVKRSQRRWEVPQLAVIPPRSALRPRLPLAPLSNRDLIDSPISRRGWVEPASLIMKLEQLTKIPTCAEWAANAIDGLIQLTGQEVIGSSQSSTVLYDLEEISRTAPVQSVVDTHRSSLARAQYALRRRVQVWLAIQKLSARDPLKAPTRDISSSMQAVLRDIEQIKKQLGATGKWHSYLELDEIAKAATTGATPEVRSELARKVLDRMRANSLDRRQLAFLNKGPFASFNKHLKLWISEPIDEARLVQALEQYEASLNSTSAKHLAKTLRRIRWSPEAEDQELSKHLELHYRNANLRLSVSDKMINLLLPAPQPVQAKVDETLLGARVSGVSKTCTRLQVLMYPAQRRWKLGLQAAGQVNSTTTASQGPATFFNEGYAQYRARKVLYVDPFGIRVALARADASSSSDLQGMETDYDSVPVLNMLVRTFARQQYDSQVENAEWIVNGKVAGEAESRLDKEVHKQLREIETKFENKVLTPLQKLDLQPIALDMRTTRNRAIVRYRLASPQQLGANTPRPIAPGDSIMSVQIHQSALNNVLQQLKLDGRQCDLRELYREMATVFANGQKVVVPADIPEGVKVRFEDKDAVRVDCRDGNVKLTIRIKSLSARRRRWQDFVVRAKYEPDAQQLDANLRRVTPVSIEKRSRRLRNVVALRAIFSKVLSRQRPFSLISGKLKSHPRLKTYQVTQFVVRDGWVGTAIGPRTKTPRVAQQTK